jgi:hypothetical protein
MMATRALDRPHVAAGAGRKLPTFWAVAAATATRWWRVPFKDDVHPHLRRPDGHGRRAGVSGGCGYRWPPWSPWWPMACRVKRFWTTFHTSRRRTWLSPSAMRPRRSANGSCPQPVQREGRTVHQDVSRYGRPPGCPPGTALPSCQNTNARRSAASSACFQAGLPGCSSGHGSPGGGYRVGEMDPGDIGAEVAPRMLWLGRKDAERLGARSFHPLDDEVRHGQDVKAVVEDDQVRCPHSRPHRCAT